MANIETKNIIEQKAMDFSVEIVNLMKNLQREHHEFKMSDQMMRAGTAIGANYCEAKFAESDEDFVHKIRIALKENHEVLYWLELLQKTDFISYSNYENVYDKATELRKMLTASVNTVLSRIEEKKK